MKTKKRTTSRRQTQLDRIERKLDSLLSRPAVTPPGQWAQIRRSLAPAEMDVRP